ncbi:phosphoribosyltransferase family protein [Phocoenobacter skyensis]|uniref:Phosphoribosyltransferase family protein n=1 Tax=Phocoenobacter skyensis TaxID=97481 RepID=A0ABT9JKF6_9PAST|nr:phosphoribosyltransferase family protein [Pasteurella skyensis]MDP8079490.1 phosphoribosyltransferase family protein [Pasteurella skyensis]MDP8085293.1 phosphoribosyltransferase family protein [Pasteurella skyensis]
MNIGQFRCFQCEKPLAISHHGFCSRCYKQIEQSPYCGCCGSLLLENSLGCGNCLQDEPKWHKFVQICWYKSPLTHWIADFKFHQCYYLDQPLARLLLLAITKARREHFLTLPEVIIPVPLYWQRHWKRGYNQAELLTEPLSKWLNIPMDTDCLTRVRSTIPQRELSAQERRTNLKKAFCYQPIKPYKSVAIVDDVVTTGSTINAICVELLKQGVKEIQVWTLCRA